MPLITYNQNVIQRIRTLELIVNSNQQKIPKFPLGFKN